MGCRLERGGRCIERYVQRFVELVIVREQIGVVAAFRIELSARVAEHIRGIRTDGRVLGRGQTKATSRSSVHTGGDAYGVFLNQLTQIFE